MAASIKNIGIVYHNKGDRAAATEMFTKAYHIFLKVLGPHHPETQVRVRGTVLSCTLDDGGRRCTVFALEMVHGQARAPPRQT